MRAFSQGLRPGLSCTTLSGSSAYSKLVSPRYVSETYDNRHRSCVAADCRPSAPHQGFTVNRQAMHSRSHMCETASATRGQLHIRRRRWDHPGFAPRSGARPIAGGARKTPCLPRAPAGRVPSTFPFRGLRFVKCAPRCGINGRCHGSGCKGRMARGPGLGCYYTQRHKS